MEWGLFSARTPSIDLRKELNWVPLVRRRDMFQLFLVHRCVTRRAPRSLSESLRTNGDIGNRRTRGWNNLFLPLVSSELFRRSFTFKGSRIGTVYHATWRLWGRPVLSGQVLHATLNRGTLWTFHRFYFSVFVTVLCCKYYYIFFICIFFAHKIFVKYLFISLYIMQDSQVDQPMADEIFLLKNYLSILLDCRVKLKMEMEKAVF